MGLHHSPKIVTNGLVLALDAGDRNSYTSGSSTWNDLSGNGYNATLVNSPDFSSVDSGKIQLDGVDDYIDLPSNANRNHTIKNSTFTIVFNDSRLTTSPGTSTYLYYVSQSRSGLRRLCLLIGLVILVVLFWFNIHAPSMYNVAVTFPVSPFTSA